MDIKAKIKEFIEYDNYINIQNKKLKNIKKKKDDLDREIVNYLEKKNLTKQNIKIENSKIICKESKTYSTLNQNFIKKNLRSYFNENHKNMSDSAINNLVEAILNYILKSRTEKTKISLKRILIEDSIN